MIDLKRTIEEGASKWKARQTKSAVRAYGLACAKAAGQELAEAVLASHHCCQGPDPHKHPKRLAEAILASLDGEKG